MRSPSSTQWTPNEKPLQTLFNALLSFHARSFVLVSNNNNYNKLKAGGRHGMPPPLSSPRGRRSDFRRRADGNVAAVSHGQHVLTPTAAAAWRANTTVSKAAWWPWPLTFWPWKWCPSHVWRGLPLYHCNFGLPRPLCSRLRPDVRDRQTDVRQKHRLMPPPIGAGHNNLWKRAVRQIDVKADYISIMLNVTVELTLIYATYFR